MFLFTAEQTAPVYSNGVAQLSDAWALMGLTGYGVAGQTALPHCMGRLCMLPVLAVVVDNDLKRRN